MEGRLLLDVVVAQRAAIFQLLAREDEALLVRRDALLVLDFLFHVVDRVRRLDVQRDGLARQRLDEDLRARESSGVCRREFSSRFEKEASCAIADVCLGIAAAASSLGDVCARAPRCTALHGDDESSALASTAVVASCSRQAFVGMSGRIWDATHLHGACVSRAQGGSPGSTFFEASGL